MGTHPSTHTTADTTADTTVLAGVDLLNIRQQLTAEERARLEHLEHHLATAVRHPSIPAWNAERFTAEFLPPLAELGLGRLLTEGSSALFQGLVHAALARHDVSLSAVIGIHNELIVGSIATLGSAQQQQEWLPRLHRLEALGAFCLTEPEHGSDVAGGVATTATRTERGWIINGKKRWIGAGTIADLALVWARDTTDLQIKCFLVPTNTTGYRATKITNKVGLRIMPNADITFDQVQVDDAALLPRATSFAAANHLLGTSRAWVGWQAVGAQQAVLDILRDYSVRRHQFGQPLAGFQLIQSSLAQIAGNLAASSSMMADIARLQEQGQFNMAHAALVKATTTRLARESAALGRDAMGGNGIVSDYEMAKVQGDIEAIYTYEGTFTINSLIVGRALTGYSAFV